jgi:thiopurine S-methyltransferase
LEANEIYKILKRRAFTVDTSFWHQRWETKEIAFHESEANPLLVKYFHTLSLEQGSHVFLPLCGKTLDIRWLLSNGYRVTGVELSKIAIKQLFEELGIVPKITRLGQLEHYSADRIDIFQGDFFELSDWMLDQVNTIYDRAALVALPDEMRKRYTAHLVDITNKAPQLLICYEYDQSLMAGPPFSISHEEAHAHYKDCYDLTLLESADVPGGLKGHYAVKENVWLLR